MDNKIIQILKKALEHRAFILRQMQPLHKPVAPAYMFLESSFDIPNKRDEFRNTISWDGGLMRRHDIEVLINQIANIEGNSPQVKKLIKEHIESTPDIMEQMREKNE